MSIRPLIEALRETLLESTQVQKVRIMKVLASDKMADLVDLNDWAVNTVRDYARKMGYNANAFYKQESALIKKGHMSMDDYRVVKRTGSKFRATRSIRRAIWTAWATREAIKRIESYS